LNIQLQEAGSQSTWDAFVVTDDFISFDKAPHTKDCSEISSNYFIKEYSEVSHYALPSINFIHTILGHSDMV
jgi:hypothetical protein